MEDEKKTFTGMKENHIEGRNAVLEAFRSGRTIDKLYVLDGCQDGPVRSITREARKHDAIISFVPRERLDQMSETGKHQGVIAYAEKHFAEARSLSESDDCVSGYGNDQSYDRYPALRKIQLDEADGGTSSGERSGR